MIETMVKVETMDHLNSKGTEQHHLAHSADENDPDMYHSMDYGDSSRGSSYAMDEEESSRPSSLPNMLASSAIEGMATPGRTPSHPPPAASVPPMTSAMSMDRCSPDSSRHGIDESSSSSVSHMLPSMDGSKDGHDKSLPAALQRQHPLFQCHLCSYSGSSRFHYNQHINTHYNYRCFKCGFVAGSEQNLKSHTKAEHHQGGSKTDSDGDEEDNLEQPKTNSQGKLKTFKCKQCDFVTAIKKDYWDHTKTHIKADKMLKCPKCPFVTEYKHHLEYHVRNHFGSKPFRCTKCSYSCVNKSMLNSHMKSHSNVYQYRCADCAYATKYCHSLKLHLRKYGHNPDVVLNADGTPNPLPIIDVYGTRRGPKMKKSENLPMAPQTNAAVPEAMMAPFPYSNQQAAVAMMTQWLKATQQNPAGEHLDLFLSRTLSALPNPVLLVPNGDDQSPFNPNTPTTTNKKITMPPRGALRCNFCEFVTMDREEFSEHLLLHAAKESEMQQKQQQVMQQMKSTISMTSPVKSEQGDESDSESLADLPGLLPKALLGQLPRDFPASGGGVWGNGGWSHAQFPTPSQTLAQILTGPAASKGGHKRPAAAIPRWPNPTESGSSPLDLSSNFVSPPGQQNADKDGHDYSADFPISPPSSSGKSRRKGKAIKLERASWARSPESRVDDESESHSPSGSDGSLGSPRPPQMTRLNPEHPVPVPEYKPLSPESPIKPMMKNVPHLAGNDCKEEYLCQYCDMSFKEVLMYTLHMGYHGYQNPFKCNMCGQETHNKVDFFVHIARSSHT